MVYSVALKAPKNAANTLPSKHSAKKLPKLLSDAKRHAPKITKSSEVTMIFVTEQFVPFNLW
jgi:hypothetical protein